MTIIDYSELKEYAPKIAFWIFAIIAGSLIFAAIFLR